MRNFDIIHRVEKGETLTAIASKYNVPPSIIASANGVNEELYEGQRLIIGTVSGNVYRVKPSDTIEVIAEKFGISPQKILQDNKTDMIFPFMDIIIKKA